MKYKFKEGDTLAAHDRNKECELCIVEEVVDDNPGYHYKTTVIQDPELRSGDIWLVYDYEESQYELATAYHNRKKMKEALGL